MPRGCTEPAGSSRNLACAAKSKGAGRSLHLFMPNVSNHWNWKPKLAGNSTTFAAPPVE